MALPQSSKVNYGGDYNPEQWPTEVWDKDYEAFDAAHIDTLTVGVFDWALLQPAENTYDLDVLQDILDRAHAEGRQVCLATATGGMPPWLATEYPEVNRVDFDGRKHKYGQRHNACHSSPVYRRLAAALAGKIAERYGDHPAVFAWHVNNEYGGFGGACYCENCEKEFRIWLKDKYGTLERLNEAWYTTFWSHRFTDWDQIVAPSILTEHWRSQDHTAFQGITLDYYRFTTDNMLRTYREEKEALRKFSDLPVTTNFMGAYRPLDYHRWAEHLDFASWDNYPPDERSAPRMALQHDLMRGLKDGQPFWVMEQTPSTTASRVANPIKRPGILGLWSWQSVAHGADAVLYFQMRQGRGACEKYHGAVLNHSGRLDTRTFLEAAQLGKEFKALGGATLGLRTPARVAVLFDWDSWWAVEMSDGPNREVRYMDVMVRYYTALWEAGADVDVVPVTAALDKYDVVVAPLLHMLKDDIATKLHAVAERGGTVISSVLSGRVDVDDQAFLDVVPGPLKDLFGIRIDEIDARPADEPNPVRVGEVESEGTLVFDIIAAHTAEVVATYGADFYAGSPAVTRNNYGAGDAWFVGTILDQTGTDAVIRSAIERHGLIGPFADVPLLEHTRRGNVEFLLNHGCEPAELTAHVSGTDLVTGAAVVEGQPVTLEPNGVLVLQRGSENVGE
ncbi:beta-galactosidase [Timonella senegalensis]|uniref:beta-galactosidase n=1 Tax=Timonella senegalensis TaxID=1465825 RepID=UPI002FDD9A73